MSRFGRGFIGRQDLAGIGGYTGPIPQTVLPSATTNAASSIGATGATLNGTANPNGQLPCTTYFQYGPTTSYGTSTANQNAGVGLTPVPVSQAIAGLTLGTTYHYRLVAFNADGTVFGADQTFLATVNYGYIFDLLQIQTPAIQAQIARSIGPLETGLFINGTWTPTPGATQIDHQNFGVNPAGQPYFDTLSPDLGDAASLYLDPATSNVWLTLTEA